MTSSMNVLTNQQDESAYGQWRERDSKTVFLGDPFTALVDDVQSIGRLPSNIVVVKPLLGTTQRSVREPMTGLV